jgi:hypothetical protein
VAPAPPCYLPTRQQLSGSWLSHSRCRVPQIDPTIELRHWRACFDLRVIAAISQVRSVPPRGRAPVMSSISPGWKPRHPRSAQAQCGVARRDRNSACIAGKIALVASTIYVTGTETVAPPQSPGVDHRMALHELPRDRGDECGHGSSQGSDQCAQAPSDCHGSTFLRRRRCWGIDQPDAFMKPGWASARRFSGDSVATHPGSRSSLNGPRGLGVAGGARRAREIAAITRGSEQES